MKPPTNAREALLAEALGEAGRLIRQVEALASALDASRQGLADAHSDLAEQLNNFNSKLTLMVEKSKHYLVNHVASRTDEAARQSIAHQSRAMADAARVAFGDELGATLRRLQQVIEPMVDQRRRRLKAWFTHAVALSWGTAIGVAVGLFLPRL